MATATWRGASLKVYGFTVDSLNPNITAGVKGNYIYARRGIAGSWIPIYIGQGDLAARADLDKHHKGACIRRKGATHFHWRRSAVQRVREAEEADLLAGNPQSQTPSGCNEQKS